MWHVAHNMHPAHVNGNSVLQFCVVDVYVLYCMARMHRVVNISIFPPFLLSRKTALTPEEMAIAKAHDFEAAVAVHGFGRWEAVRSSTGVCSSVCMYEFMYVFCWLGAATSLLHNHVFFGRG